MEKISPPGRAYHGRWGEVDERGRTLGWTCRTTKTQGNKIKSSPLSRGKDRGGETGREEGDALSDTRSI